MTFARGNVPVLRDINWHRIYVSSLFTYELPRTVNTIRYYAPSVCDPSNDMFVGGIGATLLPDYIRTRVKCKVIEGRLDKHNMLGANTPAIAELIPDYSLIESVDWEYRPEDSYFCRITIGCIRRCKFCAVRILEPTFKYSRGLTEQVLEMKRKFGEKQHLVILDNNILASKQFDKVVKEIRDAGFESGAERNGKKRTVDFNQGIDARLITPKIAKLLASICIRPIRLAFDDDEVEVPYRKATEMLAKEGFKTFTNYIMFNFNDTPSSFFHRLQVNMELSKELDIRITGFPMRFVPIDSTDRQYISRGWNWRYLRGIQCILHATHGMVSPNPEFFDTAFGRTYEEFLEIISMPDRYIVHRNDYKDQEAEEWRKRFQKLSPNDRKKFLSLLANVHKSGMRKSEILSHSKFAPLFEHYYPDGQVPPP